VFETTSAKGKTAEVSAWVAAVEATAGMMAPHCTVVRPSWREHVMELSFG
jgi:hypothetical protein